MEYVLVEIAPKETHPGRVVTVIHDEDNNREESFPVYRYKGKRVALVPAKLLKVFLALFPL